MFCDGDVLLAIRLVTGDVLLQRRFVEETFCVESFCVCAVVIFRVILTLAILIVMPKVSQKFI
jgi:hypothetical protein